MPYPPHPTPHTPHPKINFVVLRGGGGHYATYEALRAVIEQQRLPWNLSVTYADSIGERLAHQNQSLDIYKLFGTSSDEFYDLIQKNGWSWIYLLLIRLNKLLVKLNYQAGVQILAEQWRKQPPDLVVSVVPFFNKALGESLHRAKPGTPLVTILTDFADCPPSYWIEPETDNIVVCPTEKAVRQAVALGVQQKRIVKTSGLVIQPRFYEPMASDKPDGNSLTACAARRASLRATDSSRWAIHLPTRVLSERERLGLSPNCFTGLVLFGANGSNVMLDIAKRLNSLPNLQLIFICGRNQAVAAALREQHQLAVGFTQDIPYYMQLADFFIGKPGNVSISEALAMNLPVIVTKNFATLPQERYAADWIEARSVGLVIPSFRQIRQAVEKLLQPETFARYLTNVAAIDNRAVFEIPKLLTQILANQARLPKSPRSLPSKL